MAVVQRNGGRIIFMDAGDTLTKEPDGFMVQVIVIQGAGTTQDVSITDGAGVTLFTLATVHSTVVHFPFGMLFPNGIGHVSTGATEVAWHMR